MRKHLRLVLALWALFGRGGEAQVADGVAPDRDGGQFIVVNTSGRDDLATFMDAVRGEFPVGRERAIRVGVAGIFSYLGKPPEKVRESLVRFLELAERRDLPVVVQLDGEQWWDGRPDLWNWWDPSRPGFDPANRTNVEWSGWGPEHALRIAWRNWGRQIRVLPPPNLMSPVYRAACHREMERLIPLILDWWGKLPAERRDLLVGIKLGWESSIGVNAWYYPDGNRLAEKSADDDPKTGLRSAEVPARGVQVIGHAAASQAGIRTSGELTEQDLALIVRRHLEDLCRVAARLGVPRDRLFTHGGGWKSDELLYDAAVNSWSCPGWSFYTHASDPMKEEGVRKALSRSDAPWWAAVEWFFPGNVAAQCREAITKTLAVPGCRFLTIYNWQEIEKNSAALQAIHEVCEHSQSIP